MTFLTLIEKWLAAVLDRPLDRHLDALFGEGWLSMCRLVSTDGADFEAGHGA